MHKGLAGGIVVLALLGTGVGGYFVAEHKIRSTIQSNMDDLSNSTPLITSAGFESLDLDWFGDEVKLHNVHVDLDLSAMPDAYGQQAENMLTKGTGVETAETVTIKGLKALLFGDKVIKQIDFDALKFSADVVQTVTLPIPAQNQNLPEHEKQPKSIAISTILSGTLLHGEFFGFDFSQFGQTVDVMALPYKVDSYEVKDLQMILAIKQTPIGFTDGVGGEPAKSKPPMHGDISVARITGTDVSNDYIGAVHYENMIFNLSSPETSKEPLLLKVAEVSVTDTKMIDMIPLRSTTEVKGLVFDMSKMNNPKGKAGLAILGIDEINLNVKTSYDFDPDQHTLTVSAFRLGLKQVGSLDLNLAVSGMPDMDELRKLGEIKQAQESFQEPETKQASDPQSEQSQQATQDPTQAAVKAAFKDTAIGQLALTYKDEGVLKKFLAAQALQLNAEPVQIAEAYAQQAARIIMATHGEDMALKAQKVLIAFLSNPDALRIELKAAAPVNIQDLAEQVEVSGPMALQAFELDVKSGAEVSLR